MERSTATVHHAEILIIGSGPAGWTAALYAARAMRRTLVVSGLQPGGQLTITTEVENYPGFAEIQGPELMSKMRDHALQMGAEISEDHIASVDFSSRPYRAIGESGVIYTGDTVIVATGAQARWLGLPSEEKYMGFGVSACATCDGFFFREKLVAVIGGGNTAVEEALFLTKFASKVFLIHRRDELRAAKILQERAFANEKVKFLWSHVVEEFTGNEVLEAARVKNLKTEEIYDYPVAAAFIYVGFHPNTEYLKGKVVMDPLGHIETDVRMRTSVPGIYACGDARAESTRQLGSAVGDGITAALAAFHDLNS